MGSFLSAIFVTVDSTKVRKTEEARENAM
jgi:hypothetical protein